MNYLLTGWIANIFQIVIIKQLEITLQPNAHLKNCLTLEDKGAAPDVITSTRSPRTFYKENFKDWLQIKKTQVVQQYSWVVK